jgi:hypothetical protein
MWGCYYPSDSFSYTNKISMRGLVYILLSFPLFSKFPSALSASFLFFTGVVCLYGVHKGEAGDNGRAARAKRKAQAAQRGGGNRAPQSGGAQAGSWSPVTYYRKLVDENKLAIYVWVFLYFFSNALTFFYTLSIWIKNVEEMRQVRVGKKVGKKVGRAQPSVSSDDTTIMMQLTPVALRCRRGCSMARWIRCATTILAP